jgi:NAD(P)-dependent dehydrogenase (short-subunit alcohol dehydrogenase family)
MGLEHFSLARKHVVVVGASSGIGAATARECASAGASVSICARRQKELEMVLASLEKAEGRSHRMALLDVADGDAVDRVIGEFAAQGGPIDGLVYASGMLQLITVPTISRKNVDRLLAVNLTGALLSTRAATKRMPKVGGSIVFISSTGAVRPGGSGMTVYSASKGGIDGATRGLAFELAARKIRVNGIAAAAVDTPMWGVHEEENVKKMWARHPLGVGKPIDVALACVYFLSDASRWVSGSTLTMDGAFLTG